MQIRLDHKVAIVTGGSRGIGRAIAITLAAAGASVVINYKSHAAAADTVVDEITQQEGRATAVQADVSNPDDVDRLFSTTMDTYGKLDILVNNAGITRDTLVLRMKPDDFDVVLNTNLRGVYLTTKAALRPMTRAHTGRIINITSVVGLTGNAGQANYAAAKAGLIGFTKSVAREMASRSVTVNAVAPGYIDTELTDTLDDAVRDAILATIPLARFGQTHDIAQMVCFLASDAASYITGQTITVDGGMVM
ncbi:MAG: 3-oxoacyl-[acyl-carrier-protein] reductase [Chloroflexi bacterium AL-W]|nr:3-oxoacyl-[acyl-carrier-protein] reductase [Chloroflexi bacterium AL-N1]NOK69145.1 3-oxoacyl-[acyl-carrier-protein] reductase [Chloroflexi bacterium AL-N10]NOK77128.1 3-oxoacyl-[acyl-carrier-protein] reductase [Chloroflexi bacterium AL-N5]NOK83773.1 3-oxoacyl-[acyl-carrier-protein] reductase [Chloroflexi bacterium AL-W]NOK90983.1 3-oxoacyl-[acyl-carrier-protein] reductase [Chloroflexi bacterium AL-N15]